MWRFWGLEVWGSGVLGVLGSGFRGFGCWELGVLGSWDLKNIWKCEHPNNGESNWEKQSKVDGTWVIWCSTGIKDSLGKLFRVPVVYKAKSNQEMISVIAMCGSGSLTTTNHDCGFRQVAI